MKLLKHCAAIKEGAEELLAEKRVVSGAVNIRSNREKMKVPSRAHVLCVRCHLPAPLCRIDRQLEPGDVHLSKALHGCCRG